MLTQHHTVECCVIDVRNSNRRGLRTVLFATRLSSFVFEVPGWARGVLRGVFFTSGHARYFLSRSRFPTLTDVLENAGRCKERVG